jgi:hypothetical protein
VTRMFLNSGLMISLLVDSGVQTQLRPVDYTSIDSGQVVEM